ncbi:hypothetical protein [Massilia frigida]|uniref:hypothetical protein n=1 Tax=Massilia frigida TaxID=2609281 RepID=UPI0014238FCD|nr:hypothetical protein [Massilia frigida]
MSGYFGALMRASAITFGGPAPAHAAPVPTVEALAVDGAIAPAVVATPAPAAEPAGYGAGAAPVPARDRAEPVRQPHAAAATDARAGQASAVPDVARQSSAAADSVAPVAVAPHAAPVLATPTLLPDLAPDPRVPQPGPDRAAPAVATEPQGQDLMRKVLQWVAAGPQQAPTQGEPLPHVHHAQASETPAPARASVAQTPQPDSPAPVHLAIAPARPDAPLPDAAQSNAVAPDAAGEQVLVSIGAIHLRVSPPAAQVIERAPPPPAAPAAPVARSALSRRALRGL